MLQVKDKAWNNLTESAANTRNQDEGEARNQCQLSSNLWYWMYIEQKTISIPMRIINVYRLLPLAAVKGLPVRNFFLI